MKAVKRMMSTKTFPISALPLPPRSQLLIHNLIPDTYTPSVEELREKVQKETPSLQRRARLLPPSSHYSHVAPFPVSFPYVIEPPVPASDDNGAYIEKWLAERESTTPNPSSSKHPNSPLRIYTNDVRKDRLDLIGISETGLRDCVPHLDVGDAFAILGAPSLSDEYADEGDPTPSDKPEIVAAREELIDILSGHSTLMSPPERESPNATPFAPWSLRYSGHQFGSFAGQLGDGRAITVHVTPHPNDSNTVYELQLKGAGRTPFSRSADGLAVLRSSIREYLCSEAMQALRIPTTRSLTLISLPELTVRRETVETGCILTRMAPSFIRIGCFEAFNPPADMYFFGGGQQKTDYEGLRVLGEWVAHQVLKLPIQKGEAWGQKLIEEVAKRNAEMVAAWQAYGFMHGVINTDNVSILGLTIDYGPYAFMDVFDPSHICNHTDEEGRYAYKFQPNMIVYALRALLNALAPVLGAEADSGGAAVSEGWTEDVKPERLEQWKKRGLEYRSEVERIVQQTSADEYGRLMRKRFGLRNQHKSDESRIFAPFLDILEGQQLDFHSTFRTLCSFKPSMFVKIEPSESTLDESKGKEKASGVPALSDELHTFISKLLSGTPEPENLDHGAATQTWLPWLEAYAARIREERSDWSEVPDDKLDEARKAEMLSVNPRFVLRQWLLEDVIKRVERDSEGGKRVLAKVMHMACNPFEPWGAEDSEDPDEELTKEDLAERRYCGLGDKKMLGFQCSCSS
ncbi:hypothetical protein CVT24_008770 [Panaeolus cyanescens]|uniref:Selenoprotein O n=1 Tax=Panaeolus cyanescens TaxID=181874 RepID=A0A409VEC7_9AGAR|nr:hypothetical protein CVT24_008770 [Panaeolus cyanescens]